MKTHPQLPRVSEVADSRFESGHLWLFEWIDGEPLRFSVHEAGFLQFGDADRVYEEADDLPPRYQSAVTSLQASLDRDALRAAVDDVSALVFFGQSTHQQTITYDWERLPPFVGYDIWDGERYLGPAATTQAFEKLGLEPATTVEREVRSRDFDLDAIEVPDSSWYDGPAAGLLLRNKQGDRALHYDPPVLESAGESLIEDQSDGESEIQAESDIEWESERRREMGSDGQVEERQDTIETESEMDETNQPTAMDEELAEADTPAVDTVGGALANQYSGSERFERVVADLERRGEPITFDTVFECLLQMLARETYRHLDAAGVSVTDSTFRDRVAEQTRDWIDERE